MQYRYETLDSKADGLSLSLQVAEPTGCPRGVLQISHGMAEHKERYEPLMEFLAEQGIVVAIHDHRGHGKSVRAAEGHWGISMRTGRGRWWRICIR